MLKPTVKRGLMLDFISDEILCPAITDSNRVFRLNSNQIKDGDIVYFVTREFRLEDNWAVLYALELAKQNNKTFKIITILNELKYSRVQERMLLTGFDILKENALRNDIVFEIVDELPKNIGALILDFNPLKKNLDKYKKADYPVYEVDSHNIIPARFISDKQEFSAATLRRKIYGNIAAFLTEYPNNFSVLPSEAKNELRKFIDTKLDDYSEFKNDATKDFTSNMSQYLHFGFISAQRIALEILKSSSSRENKEAYLEELIVRKELSDNFCLYSKSFETFDGILSWARETLNAHRTDLRSYMYSLEEFEHAKTHDELWNAVQRNLLKTGKIHGFLRMYWAKKILEWSISPEEALKIALYLNDEYAIDGNDPNGYVGILWSIGGLHDRAFSNRLVTGKIRYMSLGGCKKKFDINKYIVNS